MIKCYVVTEESPAVFEMELARILNEIKEKGIEPKIFFTSSPDSRGYRNLSCLVIWEENG